MSAQSLTDPGSASTLAVSHFDGRQARAREARVWIAGQRLVLDSEGRQEHYELAQVRWSELSRHGQRQAQLPDGGLLRAQDAAAWDAWAAEAGLGRPLVARWAQSWRWTAVALLGLVAVVLALWRWGAPLAGQGTALLLPQSSEQALGDKILAGLDEQWLKPSRFDAAEQARWRRHLEQLLSGGSALPEHRLVFRAVDKSIGPNAFALPGGTVVITDALLETLKDDDSALLGVIGHELGHVRHRHALRLVVQGGVVAGVFGLVVGDFSSLLALAPSVLAQQAYSRDFEREADREALALLQATGRDGSGMLRFFDQLEALHKGRDLAGDLGLLSSHPADAERRRFFTPR